MRTCIIVAGLIVANGAAIAHAQFPDQFFTNGTNIDVWLIGNGQKTIMWFSREPGDRIVYQQSLVVVYDAEPQWAYYVDLGTRKFVGRYSFPQDKYSVLPEDARRENKSEIPEESFPEPGELPTVDQLLSKSQNRSKLADPPPTKNYPRLSASSWDTAYFTDQRQRIQAKVTFDGDRGSYQFRADDQVHQGTLEDVRYETGNQGLFVIRGTWRLGGTQGYFRFIVSPENLNVFQGEWGRGGRIEGTWSGVRLRDE